MFRTTSTVTAPLPLFLVVPGGPSLPVEATATYSAADPWAVRVAFRTGGVGEDTIEWMFARQLLTDGLTTPVGEGDVRVWPTTDGEERLVLIAMASPSGSAIFEISRVELVAFVRSTHAAVAIGSESEAVDLDAELSLLLPTD